MTTIKTILLFFTLLHTTSSQFCECSSSISSLGSTLSHGFRELQNSIGSISSSSRALESLERGVTWELNSIKICLISLNIIFGLVATLLMYQLCRGQYLHRRSRVLER